MGSVCFVIAGILVMTRKRTDQNSAVREGQSEFEELFSEPEFNKELNHKAAKTKEEMT